MSAARGVVVYPAYKPGSGMSVLGWGGFVETRTDWAPVGWHETEHAARDAATARLAEMTGGDR